MKDKLENINTIILSVSPAATPPNLCLPVLFKIRLLAG